MTCAVAGAGVTLHRIDVAVEAASDAIRGWLFSTLERDNVNVPVFSEAEEEDRDLLQAWRRKILNMARGTTPNICFIAKYV
jgi:hypothetical protein